MREHLDVPRPARDRTYDAQRYALLRAWLGTCAQSEVADALGVGCSALANWLGARPGSLPPAAVVAQLAEACAELRAGDRSIDEPGWARVLRRVRDSKVELALGGLWRSFDTPLALPADTVWMHNFTQQGLCWVWLRLAEPDPSAGARLVWGELEGRTPALGSGLLLTMPRTISNPPLQVHLDAPGWVDFGRGHVPARVRDAVALALHARILDAHSTVSIARQPRTVRLDERADRELLDALAPVVHARGSVRTCPPESVTVREALGQFEAAAADLGIEGLSDHWGLWRPSDADEVPGSGVGMVTGQAHTRWHLSPDRLRRLREARALPRADAAGVVTRMLGRARNADHADRRTWQLGAGESLVVTEDDLKRVEEGGCAPRVRNFHALLDMAYRADGRASVQELGGVLPAPMLVAADGARRAVYFPSYWVGPVWLHVTGPREEAPLELRWGNWRRRQLVRPGMVLTTRQPPAAKRLPLSALLPAPWTLRVGTGRVPGAWDINDGWSPASHAAAAELARSTMRGLQLQWALR